jgi:hypothetical protein
MILTPVPMNAGWPSQVSVVCRRSRLTIYSYLSVCLSACLPGLRPSIHHSVDTSTCCISLATVQSHRLSNPLYDYTTVALHSPSGGLSRRPCGESFIAEEGRKVTSFDHGGIGQALER